MNGDVLRNQEPDTGCMKLHRIAQQGVFHVTTKTQWNIPWCTMEGIPQIIIKHLLDYRNFYNGRLFAFSILPDHLHMIIQPGAVGLSTFVQTLKKNSSRETKRHLRHSCSGSLIHVTDSVCTNIETIHWQKGFYDREITNDDQWNETMRYVEKNALQHGLVKDIQDWPWTSIHCPQNIDPY